MNNYNTVRAETLSYQARAYYVRIQTVPDAPVVVAFANCGFSIPFVSACPAAVRLIIDTKAANRSLRDIFLKGPGYTECIPVC